MGPPNAAGDGEGVAVMVTPTSVGSPMTKSPSQDPNRLTAKVTSFPPITSVFKIVPTFMAELTSPVLTVISLPSIAAMLLEPESATWSNLLITAPSLAVFTFTLLAATAAEPLKESSPVPLIEASADTPLPPKPGTSVSSTDTTKLLPFPSFFAVSGNPLTLPLQSPRILKKPENHPQPMQVRLASVSTFVCVLAFPDLTVILSASSPNTFSLSPEFARFLSSLI